jgi:hypothetical protein
MKTFLSSDEVVVHKAGFLAKNDGNNEPVYNAEFVDAQKRAEYIVLFAEGAKGKDFKGKAADSVEDLRAEVSALINSKKVIKHIATPDEPKSTTGNKLRAEALDFMKYAEAKGNADTVNEFLSEYDVLVTFEETGLFFEQEITYLKKIYTMKEVVAAVKDCIHLLVD